jgi:hypothetical protein
VPLEHYNFFFSGFIKILLLFGLTSLSSFILYFEIISFKKLSFITFFIVVIETLFSSISMISRSMIFGIGALYFAMYKFTKNIKEHFNIIFFFKNLFLVICLFYVSVVSSNYLRMAYFYIGADISLKENSLNTYQTDKKNIFKNKFLEKNQFIIPNENYLVIIDKQDLKNTISLNHFLSLATYRWVGIDGVMSVVSRSDILSFKLFKKSFLDRFDITSSQFYEKTFNLTNTVITPNIKGNILPGMIAFLYYSGSLLFLFVSVAILCLFASTVEFISFMISKKNMFFSSLVSMIIAYRFIHFGYLPHQSYLLFGSLFFVIFLVFLFFYISKKLQKN